jgi:hypothetical protein
VKRKPRVDSAPEATPAALDPEWDRVLAHRPVASGNGAPGTGRAETAGRFVANGITAEQVHAALADGGDALYEAAASGDDGWADPFGGPLAVALLAAEVSALTSHLTSRAAGVRAQAVDLLLDDLSAVTVAAHLGVSRQKVYEVARGGLSAEYISAVPWRNP